MFVYFMEATSVLIGNYPYSTEEEDGRHKEKFLEILQESPLLFTYTLWGLEQSLIERETRRAGVGDHQTGEESYKQQLSNDESGVSPEIIAMLKKKWTEIAEDKA